MGLLGGRERDPHRRFGLGLDFRLQGREDEPGQERLVAGRPRGSLGLPAQNGGRGELSELGEHMGPGGLRTSPLGVTLR